MSKRKKSEKTEQLQLSVKVNYAFGGNGSFEYWKKIVKSDLMNIVGGDGESIPVSKLVPAVRARIENALDARGLEAEFTKKEIVIKNAPADRSQEYDASYRPRT